MMLGLFAFASPALAATNWTLLAPNSVVFSCGGGGYPHTLLTISQDVDGNLTGTGWYNLNQAYTWDLTGNITGDNISFTITYTALAAGSVYNSSGVIGADGSISGTTDSNCQSFSMLPASATNDDDGDDVLNGEDKCNAEPSDDNFDQWGESQGRYQWNGTTWKSSSKGAKGFTPTMELTYGCTGKQILDAMSAATGLDFGGHYKFGVTKSILEAWNAGEYHVGPTFVENVEVLGTGETAESDTSLQLGVDYFLEASGTYRFANWGSYGIADAEWAYRDATHAPGGIAGWVKGEGYYASACGLDVQVDGSCVDWGDPVSPTNEYSIDYVGTGGQVSFYIYDSSYVDNSGSISVNIFEDLWVDLW